MSDLTFIHFHFILCVVIVFIYVCTGRILTKSSSNKGNKAFLIPKLWHDMLSREEFNCSLGE